jgi:hypothetical protein
LHSVPECFDKAFVATRIAQGRDLLPSLPALQGSAQPGLPYVPVPQGGAIERAEYEPRDGDQECFPASGWCGQGERFAYGFWVQSGAHWLAIVASRQFPGVPPCCSKAGLHRRPGQVREIA